MSFINSTNKSGPKIDPWGTPDLTGNVEDMAPPITTCCYKQTKNVALITAAVITTHHESALRFRLKLCYLVICAVVTAAVINAAFLFVCNITSFKNAAKDSLPCPDNINKFLLFWGKYHCFLCPMFVYNYKFIFILSRNPFYQ